MGLASRIQSRLEHRVPGPTPEAGALAMRLQGRERPDRPTPDLAGSTVRLPPEKKSRALRTAKVEPNAPLLMRLVREPYALAPGRTRRVPAGVGRERHQVDLSRATFSAEVVALQALVHAPSPMKSVGDRRPAAPPHPFQRTRANPVPHVRAATGEGEGTK